MSNGRSLALVESATQLLNVLEWAHATGSVGRVQVAVLASREARTSRQLSRVGELAGSSGMDVHTVDPRSIGSGGIRLARDIARAEQLVIGDPFSGLIQTLLPLARASDVVVVDDGTATWEFATCVNRGQPLIRWRLQQASSSGRAARATKLLSPSLDRHLTVFTSLEAATPVGATELANDYAWTRSWCTPAVRRRDVDIVGASLVETGIVDAAAYLHAVRRLVGRYGPARYLAHRRESENRLAQLATLPGLRIVRNDLPVELALRQGPVAGHVITFPSTAAHTLPVVLADRRVRIDLRPVDASWFTGTSTPHAREFVTRIATDAPVGPVLEIV